MLSASTAKALREAGLVWKPEQLDFFVIPGSGVDDEVFAISNMTVTAEPIANRLAITFHGSVEWALDHVWAGDVIWIPREEQLRELLEERLLGESQPALVLSTSKLGYRCNINFRDEQLSFEDFEASEAYATALLHVLSSA